MVNLTIDGKQIEVPEGTTVLRAAESAGIQIPKLCDHPELTPYGGCRLCIVEVQGFRVPVASCTLPVSPNMVVQTNTEKLHTARKFILTLLFSERNHFCPFCQLSGGDCELQNSAYAEGMTHWPLQPNWNTFPVDTSHKYFALDNNRCILCRRCVRACGELVGNYTLSIAERGARSILVADYDVPLGESTCVSCGTCVQVCPTGALIDRVSAYGGHQTDLQTTPSICIGCSVGCGIDVKSRDNRVVRIESRWDAPVNQGVLCKTGRYVPMTEDHERITQPLLREDGVLKPVTWEKALQVVEERLRPLVGQNTEGVAALASTRLPAESLATFKALFKDGFKSHMVTSIEEGIPTALPSKYAIETGSHFEGRLSGLQNADCVVAIGVDLVNSHEVTGFMVKRALPKGVKLVVIDPKENELDPLAHYTLKATQGTDLEVIQALQAFLLKEGLARTNPPKIEVEKILAAIPAHTGLDIEKVQAVARLIGSAINPVFLYGKGITGYGNMQTMQALVTLARLVGAIDQVHSNLISLKGEANSLVASQYALDQSFQLNGHQAAYIALGDDHPSQRLIKRLEKAPFLVVQASYVSQLTAKANVVLPVENWSEQEGHYVNLEGQIQKANKAVQSAEGIWSNQAVLQNLAERLNLPLSVDWKAELFRRTPVVEISES